MIEETIYIPEELTSGKCKSCSEYSDEILKNDGRCIDCIEADKFYESTMNTEK